MVGPALFDTYCFSAGDHMEDRMDSVIYLVGLVVVVMVILSFLGLR